MPRVVRQWRSRRSPRPARHVNSNRTDIAWALGGITVVVVAGLIIGMAASCNFGTTTATALMADAAAVRVGDDVRVAGISVGRVTKLSAREDHIEMQMSLDNAVPLGDQTRLEVRMLTVVGGYYIALIPAGDGRLSEAIPLERVVLPYSLPEVFEAAIEPVDEVDGAELRRNIDAVSSALSRRPGSVQESLSGVTSLVDILNKQRADISAALSVADEYTTAIRENPEIARDTIRALRNLEDLVLPNAAKTVAALERLRDVAVGAAPIGRAWESTIKPRIADIQAVVGPLEELGGKLSELLTAVRELQEQLSGLISANGSVQVDHSTIELDSSGVCVPMPGRGC